MSDLRSVHNHNNNIHYLHIHKRIHSHWLLLGSHMETHNLHNLIHNNIRFHIHRLWANPNMGSQRHHIRWGSNIQNESC